MIAMPFRPLTELRLFDASDERWIARLLDVALASLGEPWRVLFERLEHASLGVGPGQVTAIANVLRRAIAGPGERGRAARDVRARVLGQPALDPAARDARIAEAAAALGLTPSDIERLLWADLALERPVMLPRDRPAAHALAAAANLERLQRAVRRAHEVELRISGDATPLVRTAARSGLLASVARGRDGATVLEIAGPLALLHDTAAYGRALAALVPLLADHPSFRLEIRTRIGDGDRTDERTVRIEPPVLLPPVVPPRRHRPGIADRLARRLAAAGCAVERDPAPIPCGDRLLFPELAVDHAGARWRIEIVAFSTDEYLARKLACYAAAGVPNVVLCVDAARSQHASPAAPGSPILPFRRTIDAPALLARMARPAVP